MEILRIYDSYTGHDRFVGPVPDGPTGPDLEDALEIYWHRHSDEPYEFDRFHLTLIELNPSINSIDPEGWIP